MGVGGLEPISTTANKVFSLSLILFLILIQRTNICQLILF
jgi:hypothetical protein